MEGNHRSSIEKAKQIKLSSFKITWSVHLLNYFGEVLERITGRRLTILAETTYSLDPSQMRGKLGKLTVNVAIMIANRV